jgi:hypothetical protein
MCELKRYWWYPDQGGAYEKLLVSFESKFLDDESDD